MVFFINLTFNDLSGNIHGNAADLAFDFIDRFLFSWAISFSALFSGSCLFGSLFYDFLALQRRCLSGAFENLVGLCLGLLHILLIFLFDGVGFFFAASASVISASAAARRFPASH